MPLSLLNESELALLRDVTDEGAMRVGADEHLTETLLRLGLIRTVPLADNSDLIVAPTGRGLRALRAPRPARSRGASGRRF